MGMNVAGITSPAFGLASIERPDGVSAVVVVAHHRAIPLGDLGADGDRAVPGSVVELLEDWDRWTAWIGERIASTDPARWQDLTDMDGTLQPAVPQPPTIYCAGANYFDHVRAMSPGRRFDPAGPYHFVVSRQCLAAHGDDVIRPIGCRALDWEVELAVVIGRRAHRVAAERALDVVAGYTIANDISARDLFIRSDAQPFEMDWLQHKSHATFLPLGPSIVPSRFVPDPQALRLSLTVDGATMQDSSTSEMVFSVAEQVSALSTVVPLVPGDVICTGTPAGTGHERSTYLGTGQEMVAAVEGLGALRNVVVAHPDDG
jgi:2-keto-4-pentenoate hydratase/2-oxohepta-3-ene-1,7-dioic acid hydratase in catechol pathway